MVMRSLFASTILTGLIVAQGASAQMLLCPEVPPAKVDAADRPAVTERLLKRLIIALDLHGHRGISEGVIMQAHADTPAALLAKLSNVVSLCQKESAGPETFNAALPDLRKAFLEATGIASAVDMAEEPSDDPAIKTVAFESREVEESIDLSVRELWRKLWFRPGDEAKDKNGRWAVIVASPPDADSGWDELGEHQHRWKDAFFELHEPYYETNPYHAIVVGRRLPREQAERLRDYAIELGMADDAYIWALPNDDESAASGTTEAKDAAAEDDVEASEDGKLDLSILDR